jgi:hypothetical protein
MSNEKLTAGEAFGITAAIVAAVALITLIAFVVLFPLYKTVMADGKVTYCYTRSYTYHVPTQPDSVIYDLVGHREWRADVTLGQNFTSLDLVKEAAAKYGCELR